MTEEEAHKLVIFMDKNFAEKEAWVNPKIYNKPTMVSGYMFKPVKHITGIVVFGDKFPLSNQDVSLETFLIVISFMDSIKNNGVVSFDIRGENPVLFRKSSRVNLEP